MTIFFYGTLLDPDVREVVMGEGAADLPLQTAVLTGYRRVRASTGNFPILKPDPDGWVEGALHEGPVDRLTLARMAHFEGDEYQLVSRTVACRDRRRVRAWAFLPTHVRYLTRQPWSLRQWQHRNKPRQMPYFRWLMRQPTIALIGRADVPWRLRRRTRQVAERLAARYGDPSPDFDTGYDEISERAQMAAE